ncbi:MAG: hypothetical protein QHH09_03695 [Microgenomates group bacterium]|nr:hypothetical protein [Microgenomates group bacterium]
MKKKIKFNIYRYISKSNLITIFSILVVFVLLFFNFFALKGYLNEKAFIENAQKELEIYKQRKEIIELANKLSKQQIDDYINLLTMLIPNEEDFFSIIYALEKISQNTNFIITNYTIDLGKRKPGKLTILVDGQGDAESFINFLKNYQFSGGRLATSEKIDFSNKPTIGTRVSLNFYSKDTAENQATTKLTEKEIAFLDKIKEKFSFALKKESEAVTENYPRKTNPF